MKDENEINQITEIINKLDVIQDDEWQRKEGETEEEFEIRLETIEEELEEELLDYISDSLLAEEKINEEEVIKEAREKINADYDLFGNAFIKDANGTIKIKSQEELEELGYDTPEEIEKLNKIAENINFPEIYIEEIKESIKASKDIDTEIERKMEFAKSIIDAKKRGETLPSSLNPNLGKDKFEEANNYIANTITLRKVPIIQNEYINNNYIAERRYNKRIRENNSNNNVVARSNMGSVHTVTPTVSQVTAPLVYANTLGIVTKKIPERKEILYTNFEKKLDKNNDLTKQKIKARTEMKSIFKKFENKELTKEETEELNSKIEDIKKAYPNAITEKTINKLYDTFKIKLPENETEQQANVVVPLNEAVEVEQEQEPETGIMLENFDTAGVISTTIGKIKQKSEEKIEDLKQKGMKILGNITQKELKENNTEPQESHNPLNATTNSTNKVEKKSDIQPVVEPSVAEVKVKISKEKMKETIKKIKKLYSSEEIHVEGIDRLIINKLICYLQDNNDSEIQETLNNEIIKLQTDMNNKSDELYIYNPQYINLQTLKYMYNASKNGVKSSDGSREIIPVNQNAAAYYLYLANNVATDNKSKENQDDKKAVIDEFESKKEDTCYRYFKFLKEKYNLDKLTGIERIKAECQFVKELMLTKSKNFNTTFLDFAISKELCQRSSELFYEGSLRDKIEDIEVRIKHGERLDTETFKLLGNLYYEGLKNASDKEVLIPDKRKAIKIYEQIINKNGIDTNLDICYNLISAYTDKKTPFYDKSKANKLKKLITKKGLHLERKTSKTVTKQPSTYVCSDLHGEYPVYQAIIDQLKEGDKLYVLGDVIDRGPDGIQILQDIMKRKEKGQVEFLIGNHELMMIKSLFMNDENQSKIWTSDNNDGKNTKEAFEKLSPAEQSKMREFLFNSFVYKNIKVNSQNIHLVHAKAVQDENDNTDKTVKDMIAEGKEEVMKTALWARDKMSDNPHPESAKKGVFTVIGHSPTGNNMIEYKNGYLDIDCGAGYLCNASLVNLTNGVVKYFRVLTERKKLNNNKQCQR